MPRVHFLSQIRPGLRMGMGHYERLLFTHLMNQTRRDEWQFAFTCDGRIADEAWRADASQHPDFVARDSLGIANVRLQDAPYNLVRALANLRFGSASRSADLFHSLSLSFVPPSNRPSLFSIYDLPPARFSDEGRLPKWAKRAAQDARKIATVSEFGKREIIELLEVEPSRVEVVPCGLESDRFNVGVPVASQAQLKGMGIEGPFLLYVGGASQRKNVPNLLEAWRQIAPHHPGLSLVFVGPPELETLVRQASAPRTSIVGYLNRDDLPPVLRAARALVFPSVYEGFGLPPLESLALGVPVVATRLGAVPEVVGDCAVLAEDGSPEALAHALETLLGDPELEARLRQNGPKRAALFSWPDHAQKVLGIYRGLLG